VQTLPVVHPGERIKASAVLVQIESLCVIVNGILGQLEDSFQIGTDLPVEAFDAPSARLGEVRRQLANLFESERLSNGFAKTLWRLLNETERLSDFCQNLAKPYCEDTRCRLDESFQSVNRFTSDASHELRTPLTIIRGELETLLLDHSLSKTVRETIYSLIEETENLSKIVQCLLSLSRLDSGSAQMERVRLNLADLVAITKDQMAPLADEKRVTLTLQAPGSVEVEGDRIRLKQVVVNLLDNAIKYTPAGGKVTVGVNVSDWRAQLEVSDNGPGIPDSDLPHVFDRFFRADGVRLGAIEGAGLGLSIVQSICAAHGGLVNAENHPTGGCRFIVQLPLPT